ncbi:membrane protein [Microbacterium phage Katzastrophic]|uniref:membrane protein n=1 Tax=Microbacterium phage Katzastrophic TaxID=2912654 RepID=UPI00242F24D9|nr:membrane protein [Microbacterium phage Katzastrophic]UKH48458.1 membrane protein [Microbacterium phage Katzastrophic]
MEKNPAPPRKRQAFEAAIRYVDMFVYAVVFMGGAALAVLPFGQATAILQGYEVLVVLWAALLIGGGLMGFLGRLTRYWMVENSATIASAFGVLIYAVILGRFALESIAATFTWVFVVLAFCLLVRRWMELQLFGSEPGDWRHRLALALARRTANTVNHTR